MRDKRRIRVILNLLEELWNSAPDLRLAQIISNIQQEHNPTNADVFYLEDDLVLKYLLDNTGDKHEKI